MENSDNIKFPSPKNREEQQVDIDLDVLNETIEYIRPAVQADGGDIKLASVDNGVVNIEMLGACVGCPLSIATLKSGIERILKDKVPGVQEVIAT
jgi:Fe-S cluster biogenesis protein NfuA